MRTTFNETFRHGLEDISRTAEQLADAQRRVSSGRRINAPSDDPAATVQAINERATLATLDSYTRAGDTAFARLAVADSVLSDVINQLTAARVATVGARGSARGQAERDAAASELLSIRDALLADINTTSRSAYLFSGAASTTPPYVKGPGGTISAYNGDASPVSLDVAGGRSVQVSFDGGAIFQGSDPNHVLDSLTSLASAVAAGDEIAIEQGLAALDRAFDRAVVAQTRIGVSMRSLGDLRPQLASERLAALTRVSKLEDADIAKAISDMASADAAHRAALGAFAAVGRLSLMDYLK